MFLFNFLFTEFEEPNYDNQSMGGTGMYMYILIVFRAGCMHFFLPASAILFCSVLLGYSMVDINWPRFIAARKGDTRSTSHLPRAYI